MRVESNSGYRLEQLFRRNRAAQAFELRPAAGADHLRDRLGQHRADLRQRIEAFDAFPLEQRRHLLAQPRDRLGRAPIGSQAKRLGSLLLEQLGHLAQSLRDLVVEQTPAAHHDHGSITKRPSVRPLLVPWRPSPRS